MAQTIAIQRGASSVSNNTITTLFTQSGGTATRVIANMLTFYANTSGNGCNATLIHTSSGGGSHIVGYLGGSSGLVQTAIAVNGMSNAASWIGNASGIAYGNTMIRGGSTAYQGTLIQGFPVSPASNVSYLPQNFWIGPSDTLSFGVYDSGWSTIQVAWSFTTITES